MHLRVLKLKTKQQKEKKKKRKKNSITGNIHHYTFEYLPCITRLNLVSIVTNTNKDCPSKSAVPQVKILRWPQEDAEKNFLLI